MWGYILGTTIGSIVISILLILVVIRLLKKKKHNNKIKLIGRSTELKVNSDLKIWANQTKNYFMSDTLFKYGTNKVFEVDSLLVTSKALIVIEIKSIKGIITGDSNSTYWEKKLGNNTFKIKNALVQNEIHIDHIVKMTGIKVPTISLIVFSDRASLLKIDSIPSHAVIVRHSDMFDALDEIDKSLNQAMDQHEMKTVFARIKSFKTTDRKDINLHKQITRGK